MISPIVAAKRTGEVWQTLSRRPGHPLVPSCAMSDRAEQRRGGPAVLAVDIGGTKLATAVVDGAGGLHVDQQAPTAGSDAETLFELLCSLIDRSLAESQESPEAIGVGGRPAYVMPNPSGLNAHDTVASLAAHLRTAAAGPPTPS